MHSGVCVKLGEKARQLQERRHSATIRISTKRERLKQTTYWDINTQLAKWYININIRYIAGLEIKGCREPRAPSNSPAAASNFCREPKYVLVSIYTTPLGS